MTERLNLAYDPPGATLKAFRSSVAAVRALIGPLGGGREECAVMDMLLRTAQSAQRRWRWLVVRGDEARLDGETLAAWHQIVPPSLGQWDPKGLVHKIGFAVGGRPKDIEIVFLALDKPEHRKRFGTAEASAVWLDGARELDEAVLDQALAIAGSWPLDEPAAPIVIATSLMPAQDHWLARRPDVTLFRQPGGRTPQAENFRQPGGLKPGFYQRLAQGRGADFVRVMVDAEWAAAVRGATLERAILQSYEEVA